MDGKLRLMTAVYISRGEEMLLLYRIGSRVVAPSYCGVGGHVEPEEIGDARACALRELREETGLGEEHLTGLSMRYACLRLKNGEVRHNYYFFAQLADGAPEIGPCDEGRLEWVPYDEVLAKPMPHSAYLMMKHYLETGRYTDTLYAGAAMEDAMAFTPLREFPEGFSKPI